MWRSWARFAIERRSRCCSRLSSGVKGFTTIHAGSARQALTRLRFICQLSEAASELPLTALNTLVSESIDVVVHCARGSNGPRVTEIVAVEDLASGADAAQFTVTPVFARHGDGPLAWTGNVPVRLGHAFQDGGGSIHQLLESRDSGDTAAGADVRDGPAPRARSPAPARTSSTPRLVLGQRDVRLPQADASQAPSPARLAGPSGHRRTYRFEISSRSSVSLAVVGGIGAYAVFGGILPALATAVFAATFPLASYRVRRQARRAAAMDAWPRLLEELRILTSSMGRSIPQALFEVGRRAPEELRPAFAAARREWLLSTDFARTLRVLKANLADPTADAVCETLLVAHEVGGTDLDRRLEALIDDRVQDTQGRKDAVGQAGRSSVREALRADRPGGDGARGDVRRNGSRGLPDRVGPADGRPGDRAGHRMLGLGGSDHDPARGAASVRCLGWLAASALALMVGATLVLSELRWFSRQPLVERLRPYGPGASPGPELDRGPPLGGLVSRGHRAPGSPARRTAGRRCSA